MNCLKSIESLKKTYDKLLGEVAKKYDLTLNELNILVFLNDNHKNNVARDIVEGLGATKSHISMSVGNLEKRGYIVKSQDENDKKKSHLNPTEKSIQVIKDAKKVQRKIKEIMAEGITEEEWTLLNNISQKIADNLERYNKK